MVRYEFQAELFGLTNNQRQQAITFVNNAIANGNIVTIGDVYNLQRTAHDGSTEVFVELSFTTRADADSIFTQLLGWVSTRAGDGTSGEHSYVRLTQIDDAAMTRDVRYAESPGWADTDPGPLPLAKLA